MTNTESASKTILLVEDDLDIRSSMQELLELEGFQVLTAEDGRDGLKVLNHAAESDRAPRLILLDLMLPVMGAGPFIQEKKKLSPELSQIPVLIFSADSRLETKAAAIGADGYIKKPIDVENFLEQISRYYSQGSQSQRASG